MRRIWAGRAKFRRVDRDQMLPITPTDPDVVRAKRRCGSRSDATRSRTGMSREVPR
jgi:hypothetical protein